MERERKKKTIKQGWISYDTIMFQQCANDLGGWEDKQIVVANLQCAVIRYAWIVILFLFLFITAEGSFGKYEVSDWYGDGC